MRQRKLWISILAGIMAFVLVAGLIVGVLPGKADAESLSELKKQLSKLEADKKEIDKEISSLRGQLSGNLSDMKAIVAQKNTIDQEIFMLNEQTANLNEQIATYSLLIADTQEQLTQAENRLAELNKKNKERIRAMEEDGSLSYWSVLFKANDFADLLDRLNMVEEIAASDRRRLKEMSAAAEEVAKSKATMEEEVAGLEATKTQLEESQKQQEVKREEADRLLAELIATGEEYEMLLAYAEDQAKDLKADIKDKKKDIEDAEYAQWLATSKPATSKPASSNNDYVASDAKWVTPCTYRLFSSPYGWRMHPVIKQWRFHYGVDLASPKGTPIVASRAGKVIKASYDSGYGYHVIVDHGDGFTSLYAHLTHYIVSVGQSVSAGEKLGEMGSTGMSTGSHLHFSILYNGNHVNPALYINI